jgi:hypothetical protein
MYIDQFNTSKEDNYGGYPTETSYYGQTQYLPAVLRLGRHNNGDKLTFRNVQWTMEGSYSGVRTDYKVKARLYWLNSDHIVSWQNTWSTPNYSNGTFSITLPDYTVTSTGSGYDWTLLLDFKGPNPSNNRSKSYKFNVTADLVSNMSINTKIGTDGYRTVTPTSETWVDKNQITNLYYGSNTNLYGSNYKLFGTSVDKYGTNKVYGSATIDTTNGTPMSSVSYYAIDGCTPLVKVQSGGANTLSYEAGTIRWPRSNNHIWGQSGSDMFVLYDDSRLIPKTILLSTRNNTSKKAGFAFTYDSTKLLPIGTEVEIINHTGDDIRIVPYIPVSPISNMVSKLYKRETTGTSKYIDLGNGSSSKFVHIGDNYWKQTHLN